MTGPPPPLGPGPRPGPLGPGPAVPVPGPPPAGSPAVDRAVSRLDDLADRPVGEHVEVFDEVHRLLQDALATLDGG